MLAEMTPAQVAAALADSSSKLVLIDVREAWEIELVSIAGSINIPLSELPTRFAELPQDTPLAMMCHGGVRSAQAGFFLNDQGFSDVYNVAGGIDRWSVEVDPTLARY